MPAPLPGRTEPGAGVQFLQLCQTHVADGAAAICGAVHSEVVNDHRVSVA